MNAPLRLRDYQRLIVDHILDHRRCNVFVPMGLGKSVSTLTAIDTLMILEDITPALIVAPLRVARSTWPEEARKFPHLRHLRISVITGDAAERRAALDRDADIYCINYDNLNWLDEALGGQWPYRMVIADECSRLKGFRLRQGTRRARAIARHLGRSDARYVGLSGTPAANGLKDLWALMWMVDKGQRLGRSFQAFQSRWFRAVQLGPDPHAIRLEPLPHAQNEIEQAIRDVCLSLDAREYFDLSEPLVNVIRVDLPPRARRLYRDMEREMFLSLECGAEIEAFNAASKTVKLLQLASGAVYMDDKGTEWAEVHDAKIRALEDIIEEAAGMPVLVAYHFRSDLARLLRAFPQGRALDDDPQTVRDWNAGKISALFAHPASAGHGLNLQDGGNILVFFSHWWDLEQYQQIVERIGPARQAQAGHNRPVHIHQIIAADTIDEIVMARRESKREVQDLLLEAMRRRLTDRQGH